MGREAGVAEAGGRVNVEDHQDMLWEAQAGDRSADSSLRREQARRQ